jgi:phospholipase/lecithinase/hemolysin
MLAFLQIGKVFLISVVRYLVLAIAVLSFYSACQQKTVTGELPNTNFPARFGPGLHDISPFTGGCTGLDCDIIITMYADASDPYSAAQSRALDELLRKYHGRIALWKKDLVRPETAQLWEKSFASGDQNHPGNYPVRISICAHEQGVYWPMNRLMEENPNVSSRAELFALVARRANFRLNRSAFQRCVDAPLTAIAAEQKVIEARNKGVNRSPFIRLNIVYRDKDDQIVNQAKVELAGAVHSAEELDREYIAHIPEPAVGKKSERGFHMRPDFKESWSLPSWEDVGSAVAQVGTALRSVVLSPFVATLAIIRHGGKVARLLTSEARDGVFDPGSALEIANRTYLACSTLDKRYPHTSITLAGGKWQFAWKRGASKDYLSSFVALNGERLGDFYQVEHGHSLEELHTFCQQSIDDDEHLRAVFFTNKVGFSWQTPAFSDLDENPSLPISRVAIFGDSLSDAHNFQLQNRFMPNAPYWGGNFSNGPTWSIHFGRFAPTLPILNLAYGGATSSYPNFTEQPTLGKIRDFVVSKLSGNMLNTVAGYIDRHPNQELNARTLFVLWIGGNDYLKWLETPNYTNLLREGTRRERERNFEAATTPVVEAIDRSMRSLYNAGARNFVLVPLPDLSLTPLCKRPGADLLSICGKLNALHTKKLNKVYRDALETLSQSNILLVNINSFISTMLGNKDRFQLTANDVPCYNGAYGMESMIGKPIVTCKENAEKMVFFDEVHPNSRAHCWIASFFLQEIKGKWPDLPVGTDWLRDGAIDSYCLNTLRSGN